MKKYPFSTKAAKAMIAATIAFTPVATTAGVFGADKVEAAMINSSWRFNNTAALATYGNAIYAEVDTDLKDEVDRTKTLLEGFSSPDWEHVITPLQEGTSDLEYAADFIELVLSIPLGTMDSGDINSIITSSNGTGGAFEGASSDDYLGYLESVEATFHMKYDALGTKDVESILKALVVSVKEAPATGTQSIIKNKLSSTLVVNSTNAEATAQAMILKVNEKGGSLSTFNDFKLAIEEAARAWHVVAQVSPPPPPSSDSGGTPPVDNGTVTPPPPGEPVVVEPVVEEGATEVVVTIPAALQAEIVTATPADTTEIVINVPESTDDRPVVLDLPASLAAAIQAKAPAADIVIDAGGTKYILPLSQVDMSALAAGLGGNLTGVTLRINIDVLTSAQTNSLENRIQAKAAGTQAASSETKAAAIEGAIEIKAPAVEVKVELVKDNAVVSELNSFGDVYVEQEFTIDGTVNTNKATGVVVAADGSFKALPTKFKTVDGKQIAVVSTLANTGGVSTVTEASVTFPDVNNGKNWAEKEIEALASKFIISGTTAGTYKPDQEMTRSQFAFLLSRALGLPGTTAYDKRFSDVKGDEWFNANGEFMAAVKYGVITGKPNGTFAPDAKVTRAEAAAMIGRALELDFINFDEKQLDKKKTLANFKDAKEIGASTRAEVLKVYQAGIMSGASNGEFNPNDYTKRDQMARILAQFLVKANLMDSIK